MPSGMCWFTSQPNNKLHNDFISQIYSPAIHRIFIDIADFARPLVVTDYYVKNTMDNLPDGMRYWENDEGQNHVYNGTPGEGSTKDMLAMCKNTGAIPLLCLGHSEERTSWLTRNPINHLDFLEKFCRYLAYYLKDMGFLQAHAEVFNEPQKCIGGQDYGKICKAVIKGFCISPNYKVHVGSNDITIDLTYKNFIDDELKRLLKGNYYSTHILQHSHHGKLLQLVNELKPIKVSVTEFSPNGNWGLYGLNNNMGAFNELIDNNIEIYCLLFGIRRDFFADVYDEIRVFTREPRPELNLKSGDWLPVGFAYEKYIALRNFNKKYFNKKLPLEWEGIMLEKYYYRLKTTFNRDPNKVGVKFIQSALGLTCDGVFGLKTENAVRAYQISKFGTDDGIVGPGTFTAMIADFPRLYNEMHYNVEIGAW